MTVYMFRGNTVKSLKTTMYATRFLIRVALSLVFAKATVLAQGKPIGEPIGKSTPQQSSPSDAGDKNRSRRAVPNSPEEKPAEKAAEDLGESAAKTADESASDPKSDLMTLRDEIEAASDARERARLQLKLADQLALSDRKQEAIAELHSITAEDRFDPQGFYNVANALARLGELDGAVSVYRKAIEQRKGRYSRAYNNLGVVLLRQGRWEEAYEAFMSALRLEGFRYAEASYNLGHLYAVRGERDLAIREWQRAVAVDPDHTAAKLVLASAGRIGNIIVETKVAAPSRVSHVSGPARSSEQSRKPSSSTGAELPHANSVSPRTLTVDPQTYSFLKRARTARERGRDLEAVENYRRVMARMDGYFPPANLELSYALYALKRHDEALATLLPVTQRDGASFPISYYHVARLYELRGDLKLAEENYSRAIDSFSGNNSQFILDLSRVREKLGNFQGALSAMEQYVSNMQQQGRKPEWSEERLSVLRQKVAAAQTPSKP